MICFLKYLYFFLGLCAYSSLLGQSGIVTFSDQSFENTVRRMAERGWIWIPDYSSDYQFSESDLSNVFWLDFDEDDLKLTSLSDLQWFPSLRYLHIWDASKISDFSPIWEFSNQLLQLSINGSRGADLSGVATMNALETLDLDDNQLTNLSILGNHPNLTQLYLTVNFLDLADSLVMQKIESLSSQISERRNQLGWWYSDDAVEYEPQYPLGFRNLSSETSRVQQIINSAPNDAEANLLRGIYALLNIYETNDAHGIKEFAVSAGVDPAVRDFVLSDLGMIEDYDAELDRSFQSGELAELFEQSIIPSLESADFYFSKVPSSSVIALDPELTGTEGVVSVDYADVLVLRAITNLLACLYALQSGYDWDVNAGHMEDLDNSGDMSAEEVRAYNSNFGGIRSAAQLAKAKVFLQSAISIYNQASPLITDSSRLDNFYHTGESVPDRLFVLSFYDLDEEQEFRDALNELQKALDAPYELKDDDWEVVFASGGAPTNLLSFQTPETTDGAASNLIIQMFDSYGDGWNDASLTIVDDSNLTLVATTFHAGNEGKEIVSLAGGETYFVSVTDGQYPEEVSWRIISPGPVFNTEDDDLVAESEIIDLSRLFAGQVDLATLLPESKKDKFVTDQIADPTMGGLLPDWTQHRVSDEIEEAELLWDERAMVFWRWEAVTDDPHAANSWNKQSVVLRYLGDNSEELLYSVNAKDLVIAIGLDPSMNSGVWLQESKVCVSPDGSQLIFGYSLMAPMWGGYLENRSLVRIFKYDLTNRTSSIIREWIGSNLSDSHTADYVDFCIDAMAVDWNNEKIYFSEEILSSDGANEQIDYIKLVSCDFDGQNLTAVKRFERRESGMSNHLAPSISMIHLRNSDSPTIRVSVEYSESTGSTSIHEIYTIDASGNQLVVPIENDNSGDPATSIGFDSFNTFALSEDEAGIYFINYNQDSYSSSVIGPFINKMTSQGYDTEIMVDLSSLSHRSIKPEVVMMSEGYNGKIMLGVEYPDSMSMYQRVEPSEILEVDLVTGEYNVLTVGILEWDWSLDIMFSAYDDFSTASLFYPDGTVEPPQITTDSDGDGLPDDVEIAAGMDPNSSDKAVVDAVYDYFFSSGSGPVKSLQKSNPYTHSWYYQPGMGWMWTSGNAYPYIFKSGSGDQTGSWMFYSEESSDPIRMYDFERTQWISLGEVRD